MSKRVLVTGASGFIGSSCLQLLADAGVSVIALSSRGNEALPGIEWVKADLLNSKEIEQVIHTYQPTHLLHLAWYVEHGLFWNSLKNFSWMNATIELARAFYKSGGKCFVFAGSCTEYDWTIPGPYDPDQAQLNGKTLYGQIKTLTHKALSLLADKLKASYACGRVFYLYGPKEDKRRFVPSIFESLIQGKPAMCMQKDRIVDLLHVDDVARGFIALLDSEVNGAFNIASGQGLSLGGVAQEIATISDSIELLKLEQIGSIENPVVAKGTKLQDQTGWKPQMSLKEGLEQTYKELKADLQAR